MMRGARDQQGNEHPHRRLAVKASQVAVRPASGVTGVTCSAQEAVQHDAATRGRWPRALRTQALRRRTSGVACAILLAWSSMRRMSAKVVARLICSTWRAR